MIRFFHNYFFFLNCTNVNDGSFNYKKNEKSLMFHYFKKKKKKKKKKKTDTRYQFVIFEIRFIYNMFLFLLACARNINVRENRRGNQEWTIQRNWKHRVHKTKTKTNKIKTQHNMYWTPLCRKQTQIT